MGLKQLLSHHQKQYTHPSRSKVAKENVLPAWSNREADLRCQLAGVSNELKCAQDMIVANDRAAAQRESLLRLNFTKEIVDLKDELNTQRITMDVHQQGYATKLRDMTRHVEKSYDDTLGSKKETREALERVDELEKQLVEARMLIHKLQDQVDEFQPTIGRYRCEIAAFKAAKRADDEYIAICEKQLAAYGCHNKGNVKSWTGLLATIEKLKAEGSAMMGLLEVTRNQLELEKTRCCNQRNSLAEKSNLIDTLQDSYEALLVLFGGEITPRTIVTVFETRSHTENRKIVYKVPNKELLDDLNVDEREMLMQLRPDQIFQAVKKYWKVQTHLTLSPIGGGLKWLECRSCKLLKLHWESRKMITPLDTTQHVYDFLPDFKVTPCCRKRVCKSCLRRSFEMAIDTHMWWSNDSNLASKEWNKWLACPVADCNKRLSPEQCITPESSLKIRNWVAGAEESVLEFAKKLGMPDDAAQRFAIKMENIHKFRISLGHLHGDAKSYKEGAKLFHQLIREGYIQSLDEPALWGRDAPIDQGSSMTSASRPRALMIRTNKHTGEIPFLVMPLKRSHSFKTCFICSEEFYELINTSRDDWRKACKGYEGAWMSDMFYFPTKEELACAHDLDTCKQCYKRQIATQLETHGQQACNLLSCPSCDRKLSQVEIQRLATKEDFAKYERFQLLTALSTEPTFRWCLSPTCDSGQLYGTSANNDEGYIGPRIWCDACDFSMCFQHQVPWHTGQTCKQYTARLSHGQEEEKSEEWKRLHTKACPGVGCGKPIVKGEGCFHMTCYQCRYEFCWECLADWKKVRTEKTAHKEGCFFRTSRQSPTDIQGTSVETAR